MTVCLLKVNITIFEGTVPSIYKYHYNYYIYNYVGQPKRFAKQFVLLLAMYYISEHTRTITTCMYYTLPLFTLSPSNFNSLVRERNNST